MTAYSGEKWLQARRAALARDGQRCQDCGTQDNLHVHHITPVREFDSPDDAHYLDNLVVLCRHCHPHWEGENSRPRLLDQEIGLSMREVVSKLESDRQLRSLARHAPKEVYDHMILRDAGVCCTCHSLVASGGLCDECGAAPDTTPSETPSRSSMLDRVPALVERLERRGLTVDVDAIYDTVRHLKTQPEHSGRATDIWRAATAVGVQ